MPTQDQEGATRKAVRTSHSVEVLSTSSAVSDRHFKVTGQGHVVNIAVTATSKSTMKCHKQFKFGAQVTTASVPLCRPTCPCGPVCKTLGRHVQ